jgi:hypothetical protein
MVFAPFKYKEISNVQRDVRMDVLKGCQSPDCTKTWLKHENCHPQFLFITVCVSLVQNTCQTPERRKPNDGGQVERLVVQKQIERFRLAAFSRNQSVTRDRIHTDLNTHWHSVNCRTLHRETQTNEVTNYKQTSEVSPCYFSHTCCLPWTSHIFCLNCLTISGEKYNYTSHQYVTLRISVLLPLTWGKLCPSALDLKFPESAWTLKIFHSLLSLKYDLSGILIAKHEHKYFSLLY